MHICEQWWLHYTSQWGSRHRRVNVCTVWSSHSKWPSKFSTKPASNFGLILNTTPWKLFRWFRRLQLWATGDWQLCHDNVPTHASHLMQSFLAKYTITQVTQSPSSPNLVPSNFWFFLKLKSSLKGKKFQTIDEIQENTTGQLVSIERTV